MSPAAARPLRVRRLGRQPYEPVWRAMQRFTDARGPETADELCAVAKDLKNPAYDVTDYAWDWQDMVEGYHLQLKGAGMRTLVYVAMHDRKLYILEAVSPEAYPEPGLFTHSMGYLDKDGNEHEAHCKTSMWTGVYFTEDRIVKYADRPAPPMAPAENTLEAENRRLRQELERVRRLQGHA